MTENLSSFSYNVLIANLHEIYSFLNKEIEKKYSKETIIDNYSKILITMLPIIPHFASECLEKNNFKVNKKWPNYNEEILKDYGYTFLLVSDETISKISNFKSEMNFDFNFLKSNKSFETIGVSAMPTSYIFNENGEIVETFVGVIEWDSEEIINKLKML